MQSLARIRLDRKDVYVTSAIRSRPYRWATKKERDGTITKRKYNQPSLRAKIEADWIKIGAYLTKLCNERRDSNV